MCMCFFNVLKKILNVHDMIIITENDNFFDFVNYKNHYFYVHIKEFTSFNLIEQAYITITVKNEAVLFNKSAD